MAIDDDLSALLPKPPPPRPARREAAIEAALRRFDGEEVPRRAAAVRPGRASGGWRPQAAALASIALIITISVPIWWSQRERIDEVLIPAGSLERRPAVQAPVSPVGAGGQPAPPDRGEPPAQPGLEGSQQLAAGAAVAAERPAPAPPAAGQAASPAAADETIMVTGSRVARPEFESNSPMVSVDEEFLEQSSKAAAEQQLNRLPRFAVAQSSTPAGGCTILDERRDLAACREFADPAARGDRGRAAALLADGLSLAWRGELDQAIDAFGRAIRADRGFSIAYLNRGLAYQAKGDLRRALADLDRAVESDPEDARGYYHRSVVRRANGDSRRADADARKAIELDRSYEALLP